ncbi:ion transporter [Paenibacillus sambharensis]|uniref:Ion transporter n=1 Tax=Paenibacillus sambharensis TaxID=1803190 RepID=A0A2W1L7M5_9BACL|nr:potassium channel family protein [Paenibacillus sambharensis]PZD94963.1 ion transporter [Paenibacillus sambharensis]
MSFKVLYETIMILFILTYGIIIVAPPDDHPYLTDAHLAVIDWIVLGILFIEFVWRFIKAEKRGKFVLRSWWEIIALIPFDPSFRLVRLLRLIRLIALIRSTPLMWHLLRSGTILQILCFTLVVILWSSVGVFLLETGINDNIQSFGDAVWWSIVTTTTVGYGDISPVSNGGRIIAVFLMITGIGMIGTITANLANHWIEYSQMSKAEKPDAERDLKSQVKNWVDRIGTMDDKEYQLMLDTLKMLRESASDKDPASGIDSVGLPTHTVQQDSKLTK